MPTAASTKEERAGDCADDGSGRYAEGTVTLGVVGLAPLATPITRAVAAGSGEGNSRPAVRNRNLNERRAEHRNIVGQNLRGCRRGGSDEDLRFLSSGGSHKAGAMQNEINRARGYRTRQQRHNTRSHGSERRSPGAYGNVQWNDDRKFGRRA